MYMIRTHINKHNHWTTPSLTHSRTLIDHAGSFFLFVRLSLAWIYIQLASHRSLSISTVLRMKSFVLHNHGHSTQHTFTLFVVIVVIVVLLAECRHMKL